jgi:heme/copper-type cytochrome/quinol oxidase subunit 2
VNVTTHLLLEPRLRMRGAISTLLNMSSWSAASVSIGITLPLVVVVVVVVVIVVVVVVIIIIIIIKFNRFSTKKHLY